MGFGAAGGRSLSVLHCSLCRSILHDAVVIESCGHKGCEFCLSRFRECPVCGVDIVGLRPDAESRALVQTFYIHAKEPAILRDTLQLPPEACADAAAFFMFLGLQSKAGGNMQAALDRLVWRAGWRGVGSSTAGVAETTQTRTSRFEVLDKAVS